MPKAAPRMDNTGNKTTLTDSPVTGLLASLPTEVARAETQQLIALMQEATGDVPRLWGPSIIGFGIHHYKYESGREGDTCAVGFAPRKGKFALYISVPEAGRDATLAALGNVTSGVSCVWAKRLGDLNLSVLKKLVKAAYTANKNV